MLGVSRVAPQKAAYFSYFDFFSIYFFDFFFDFSKNIFPIEQRNIWKSVYGFSSYAFTQLENASNTIFYPWHKQTS